MSAELNKETIKVEEDLVLDTEGQQINSDGNSKSSLKEELPEYHQPAIYDPSTGISGRMKIVPEDKRGKQRVW